MHKFIITIFTIMYALLPVTPINSYILSTFLLGISIIIFTIGLKIPKFQENPVIIFLLRILLLFISMMIILKSIEVIIIKLYKITGNELIEKYIIIVFLVIVIVLFILILIDFGYRIIKNISDPGQKTNILILLGFLVVLQLAPNYLFGLCYSLVLATFYDTQLSTFKDFYLTFAISYSLPINDEELSNTIKTINKNFSLQFIQIVHIILYKIIDLTVIATIINYINDLLKRKR
ncbi:hypothetical protein CN689_05650 [Peribacillus butanolivorans]|uniref:Uncharacterized protein n=1 Tax=Peribacillus butanolivorans TaxID=421767 RepID=A0AAX0S6K0_9BACI|nr:hypothetical protein [Peribacillus butanolivorans]PEJ35942.1 hypothetical protein CN689_05650 [Peribacillus butanolivorans]